MAEQMIIGFPYYRAEAHDVSGNSIAVFFEVQREGSLGGVSDDDVADGVRDYLAGISGVTGSLLVRRSVTQASL